MIRSENVSITQIEELLATSGYEVTEADGGVIRIKDPETGVSFQAALEGNVLYMTVKLMAVPAAAITPETMRKMLAGENGISTSSFRLYESADGNVSVTLNNFCTIQNMGEEDRDDILSLAGYLMADVVEARDLLQPSAAGAL